MRFAQAELWWMFLFIPLAVALLYIRHQRTARTSKAFADTHLLDAILTNKGAAQNGVWWFRIRCVLIVSCLVIALLQPQWGFEWKESNRKGIDIVVALDVSESMLARDISPSRLERARRELLDLLRVVRGDRLALVAFAGVAFIETPLTLDYGTFRLFLQSLTPELIPVPGTRIDAALEKSIEAFGEVRPDAKTKRSRAIILVTDGEEFEGDMEAVAEKAKQLGIRIYIIGIGSAQGAPIPRGDGYRKDKNDNIIVTRLRPEALENLARTTNGIFVTSITSDKDVRTLYERGIREVFEAQAVSGSRAKRWNEYFQIPLCIAVMLLLASPLGGVLRRIKTARTHLALAIAMVAFGAPSDSLAQFAENEGAEARQQLLDGQFEEALQLFDEALRKHPEDARFHLGKGISLYRLERFAEAGEAFMQGAAVAANDTQKAEALFNAANSLAQLQSFQEAITSYEEALKLTPDDHEIRENLDYVKRLLQEQQQQDKQDRENQEENEEQEDQDQEESEQQNEENEENQENQEDNEQQENQNQQENEREDEKSGEQKNQGQDQNQEQDNTKGQNQQDRDEQEEENKQEDKSESNDSSDATESPANSETQENEPPGRQQELEALLGSVSEDRNPLIDFRRDKALQELKLQNRKLPEKDW